jgi:hypothetical protein
MKLARIADFDGRELRSVDTQGRQVALGIIGDEARRVVAPIPQSDSERVRDLTASPQNDMRVGEDQPIALPDGPGPHAALTIADLHQAIQNALADGGGVVVDLLQ